MLIEEEHIIEKKDTWRSFIWKTVGQFWYYGFVRGAKRCYGLSSIFPWIEVLWISGTKICGFFCGSAMATAATKRLSEALRANDVEVLSVEGLQ